MISIHFLRCWQGEFVEQSRVPLVGDHFLYSRDLNVWFRGDIVRRNSTLVTLRGQRVKAHNCNKPERWVKRYWRASDEFNFSSRRQTWVTWRDTKSGRFLFTLHMKYELSGTQSSGSAMKKRSILYFNSQHFSELFLWWQIARINIMRFFCN